jgi:hypothetical protein
VFAIGVRFHRRSQSMPEGLKVNVYLDRHGHRWLLVANTRSGVYGWFRPEAHADDGYYDRSFRIDRMRLAS